MTTLVFATHSQQQCGVYQFGKQIFEALERSSKFQFIYCELSDASELRAAVVSHNPSAVIINFHPATIGWAQGWASWSLQIPTIGIMHEMNTALADQMNDALFDYYIFHDPSAETQNPLFFKAARLIHPPSQPASLPARFTVGSFGFATPGKGFEAVAARAHAEFDDCLIRFNIPWSEFCDKDGSQARLVADRCRSLIVKPGVQIEVTHDFFDLDGVEQFLAGNSINAFFYDEQEGRGISSAVDLALSARRPIAARRTSMVRHLFKAEPSIFIEDRSLREIAESGLAPLQPFIDHWTAESVLADYENMLETIFSSETTQVRQLRRLKRVADLEASLQAGEAAAIKRAEELKDQRDSAVAELKVVRAELEAALSRLRRPVPAAPPDLVSAHSPTAKLARGLNRLVRPILRPIAWRTRAFMSAEVRAELVQLNTKLDRISAALSVNEVPRSEAGELFRMLETTLLTLALDRRRDEE